MIFIFALLLTFTEAIQLEEDALEIPEAAVMTPEELKLPFPMGPIIPPPKIPPYQTCNCVKCLPGKKCEMQKKCYYDNFCPLQPVCVPHVPQCPDNEIWMECPTCSDIRDCPPTNHDCCTDGCLVAQCVCPPGTYHHPVTKKCVPPCQCPA